jgi:hypothetical protein
MLNKIGNPLKFVYPTAIGKIRSKKIKKLVIIN